MAGKVVVDDVTSEPAPPKKTPTWIGVLAAAVVVGAALLPGGGPATPATTLPVPEVVTAEDRWRLLELPAEGTLSDVTLLSDGSYVAVGSGPQVWVSEDRETWRWDLSSSVHGDLLAVTDTPHGPVAVGSIQPDEGGMRAAVWHRSRGEWRDFFDSRIDWSSFEGVVAGDGEVLAWGWRSTNDLFAPDGASILFVSDDGVTWRSVPVPEEMSIETAEWIPPRWYIGGYIVGRPAVWSSTDLEEWEEIPTDEMTFGWIVRDILPGEPLTVTVFDTSGNHGTSQWRSMPDGSWERREGTDRPPELTGDQSAGVSEGRLWVDDAGTWRPLELDGWVRAAAGGVAVGVTGSMWHPAMWVLDAAPPRAEVPAVGNGPRWTEVAELGESGGGAWRVAGDWLIGTDTGWWLFDGTDAERAQPPWDDPPSDIQQVGDEWVAYPGMFWTSDGEAWEKREDPLGIGTEAIAAIGDRVVAVGYDQESVLWTVAESTDGGRTWELVEDPAPTVPIWGVAATTDGFVATRAAARGTEEVVVSSDGHTWEPLVDGQVMLEYSMVPAVWTEDVTYLLLDRDELIEAPRQDVELVVRDGDRLVLKAGARAWLGTADGEWESVPMDPPHGIDGPSTLLPLDGRLFALVLSPDGVRVLEWAD